MRKLPYFKPFLTFEEQAGLLEERGLLITTDEEREFLADFLRNLNFHRFEGYCLSYYRPNSKTHVFKSGTSVTRIQNDYYADKRIRLETFSMLQDFATPPFLMLTILLICNILYLEGKLGLYG